VNLNSKKILITGGAGFIGFRAAELWSLNNDVVLVDNFQRRMADERFERLVTSSSVSFIEGDLTSASFVSQLPEADYIFHFAALNGTANFYAQPFSVVKSATIPTLNLLERYKDSSMARFVFSGTSESYAGAVDEFNWAVPTSEDVPLVIADITNPRWSYAAGKTASEAMIFAANHQFGTPVSVVRFHNVYGPRMGSKHVIPEYINRAKEGVFSLYGSENRRSFIYVDDAIAATAMVASSPSTLNEVIHIGTRDEVSMFELVEKIMGIAGWSAPIMIHPAPEGSVSRRQPEVMKLEDMTGFEPLVSLEEGLQRTINYYLNNNE
jgi:UDP-glucose 4-epimerase